MTLFMWPHNVLIFKISTAKFEKIFSYRVSKGLKSRYQSQGAW